MSESDTGRPTRIGCLPLEVRLELNARIRQGEPTHSLLAWLNGQAIVRATLERLYPADLEITAKNLSLWRAGPYLQWLERREQLDERKELAAYCLELAESGKSLLDGSASILGGKLMEIAESVDIGAQRAFLAEKPDSLRGLISALAALQGQANQKVRIQQIDRRLDLEDRKFEVRFLELFEKYYKDRQVQEIMEGKAGARVKMEQLRGHIFGKRPIPGKLDAAAASET
jgi:hypothetical protein